MDRLEETKEQTMAFVRQSLCFPKSMAFLTTTLLIIILEVHYIELVASEKHSRALVGCVWETMVGQNGRFRKICRHISGNEQKIVDRTRLANMCRLHDYVSGGGFTPCLGARIATLSFNKFSIEVSFCYSLLPLFLSVVCAGNWEESETGLDRKD